MVQVHIVLKIFNSIVPESHITFGRQCKDYGIFEEYSPQCPIGEQFSNIGDITESNKAIEILCGLAKIIVMSEPSYYKPNKRNQQICFFLLLYRQKKKTT